jgi:hypothetical protein
MAGLTPAAECRSPVKGGLPGADARSGGERTGADRGAGCEGMAGCVMGRAIGIVAGVHHPMPNTQTGEPLLFGCGASRKALAVFAPVAGDHDSSCPHCRGESVRESAAGNAASPTAGQRTVGMRSRAALGSGAVLPGWSCRVKS